MCWNFNLLNNFNIILYDFVIAYSLLLFYFAK